MWLTGYTHQALKQLRDKQVDITTFFTKAPELNPARKRITGVICGIRLEDIDDQLMQEIRYLDKLIDELAKGKPLEKILRKEQDV